MSAFCRGLRLAERKSGHTLRSHGVISTLRILPPPDPHRPLIWSLEVPSALKLAHYAATLIGEPKWPCAATCSARKLNAGKPTVGTHILSAWPTLVELIGHSKQYDYVEFTAEYAPFTMHDLDNLGRSFELMNMAGMIKIEQTQYTHQAMRAIGAGFQSVLFADIRSVEDAKLAVDAVRAESTDGAWRPRPRPAGCRHAPRRRHRAARRNARLCRCAERRGDRRHGREEILRRRSRPHPLGARYRHGAVRRLGLLHEHRQDRPVQPSRGARSRAQDHQDRAQEGPASARRAARSRARPANISRWA